MPGLRGRTRNSRRARPSSGSCSSRSSSGGATITTRATRRLSSVRRRCSSPRRLGPRLLSGRPVRRQRPLWRTRCTRAPAAVASQERVRPRVSASSASSAAIACPSIRRHSLSSAACRGSITARCRHLTTWATSFSVAGQLFLLDLSADVLVSSVFLFWIVLLCSVLFFYDVPYIWILFCRPLPWRALACPGVPWRALACPGVPWRALAVCLVSFVWPADARRASRGGHCPDSGPNSNSDSGQVAVTPLPGGFSWSQKVLSTCLGDRETTGNSMSGRLASVV